MTVEELISGWTEDERKQHADLISECQERERLLNGLRVRMREAEENLEGDLDHLFTKLHRLSQQIDESAEQFRRLELRILKPKAYA